MPQKMRIDPALKRFLEHEIRHCNEYRRMYEQLKTDAYGLSLSGIPSGGGWGSGRSDPTARKAVSVLSDIRLKRLEDTLAAFDRAYQELLPEMRKVIDCAYRSRINRNKTGVAMECNMHPATAYRVIHAFLIRMGEHLGLW